MNSPVALQSTRDVMDFFSAVSVVSISTFNFSEVRFSSIAAIMNFLGSNFSHLGWQVLTPKSTVRVGVREASGFRMSWVSISMSFVFFMYRTLKWLQQDNEGMNSFVVWKKIWGWYFFQSGWKVLCRKCLVLWALFLTLLRALWLSVLIQWLKKLLKCLHVFERLLWCGMMT